MSEEVQSSPNSTGFPINKVAYAKQIQELKAQGSFPTEPKGQLQGTPVKVDGAMLDELNSYVNGAIHPVGSGSDNFDKVQEIVIAEAKAYYTGQKSAENAANLIQNKVTTYLNE